ncbi:hypothetical protein F4778DRAFT_755328 [Xylariomycetidae sp. FL2044]|nr:hypothetical protein F4778DRAFT_755328 [Xylariomycetidae sp. FL2044]
MSKIDVHCHINPPAFTAVLKDAAVPGAAEFPAWGNRPHDPYMTGLGVEAQVLSVTSPGPAVLRDPVRAARLARSCNEYLAELRDADPRKLAFLASLPDLHDTARCLEELRYAYDVLGADGVCLMTRYGGAGEGGQHQDGEGPHYLGHEAFRPIWAELSRRKAVVFVHPTFGKYAVQPGAGGSGGGGGIGDQANRFLPPPVIDFPHETARAALDLYWISIRLREA